MENYNKTYLLDLPVQEAQKLYLEAAIVADNPLQNNLGLFTVEMGKDKFKMLQMRMHDNNLQPKSGCDTWNPTVRAGLSADTISVTDYEMNGEYCGDEFDAGCARLMRQPLGEGAAASGLNEFDNAMVTMLRRSLQNDIHSVVWFSDTAIRSKVDVAFYGENPYSRDPIQKERMLTMLEQQDGVWAEIEARTMSSNPMAKIAYVDTNNGVQAGNATRAENITDFLDDMITAATPQLRSWNYQNESNTFDRPAFFLQDGLYRAYKKYLRSRDLEASHKFMIEGEVVRDVLMYDGYAVMRIPEWEQHDAKMGRVTLTGNNAGYSSKQRALFTTLGNLSIVANMNSIESQPGSGLIIQASPLLKDKGKTWMYADYGLGMGVAQPDLVVAGYNSSTTFA